MAIQGRPRVRIGDGQLGHVEVTIGVGSPDRSRFIDVQATADTGATFSMLPRRVLRDLGVTSGSTERFQLADGTPVTRDVAEVPVRIEGRVRITPCILGEDGEPALVGVVTLEQFLLGVDTINGRLIPIPGLLMAQHGKKYMAALEKIDRSHLYEPKEAIPLLKETAYAKFDETVELHIRTGLDTRHAEQQLRGTLVLPHGLGKGQRVLVFAEGEAARTAEQAGADYVGSDDMIKKVEGGWLDFEVALAVKELMGKVGRLGRVLGPRGLMPNPRTNTVVEAEDLPRAIRDSKQGRVEFRTDRTNLVHVPLGKVSFEEEALLENFSALMDAIVREKPSGAKGQYIRSLTLTTTMGPGIKLDVPATLSMTTGGGV
ncbi:MAG: 50S ribosomal protein L1 [Chloroflexi bacterium]|nr:MAG: 50S ribosomal protein L1 [Chloroflexota bacterium]